MRQAGSRNFPCFTFCRRGKPARGISPVSPSVDAASRPAEFPASRKAKPARRTPSGGRVVEWLGQPSASHGGLAPPFHSPSREAELRTLTRNGIAQGRVGMATLVAPSNPNFRNAMNFRNADAGFSNTTSDRQRSCFSSQLKAQDTFR